ncbi:MAG TPA: hypothetical protein VK745_00960 [Polyangiaceae bacterium]|nr:hypothetical protein [Polyangiaceae bacterium]
MRFDRLLSALGLLSAAALTACGAGSAPDGDTKSVSQPVVAVTKSFTRKIYVHMMPWFEVGGQHWSMNARNPATGVASYYSPMIGEYSSNDGNVIEYQLLTMKYAGIDGVLIDWPGLNGSNDLPQNKANTDAIIARTAEFGLSFGVVYEDQYGASVAAAQNDMSYVRDNFFNKPNAIQVNNLPAIMVFGPQKFVNASDWSTILSVFPTNPMFFSLWYNNDAGANADGHFAWVDQNALKGVSDFDTQVDGADEGWRVPIIYPGFNPYYAAGGWPGPTWKISYTLNQDNTEGGNTFASTFALGQYAGDPIQIATWNDYGEGTMIEPTNQLQYQFLTTLQQSVGLVYTDAELKIVKMLFDQRRATNGSNAAQLDKASTALANLDLATACSILGCTVPVHTGTTGGGGSGGTSGSAGGSSATGGTSARGGAPSSAGSSSASGGHAGSGTTTGSGAGASAAGATSSGNAGSTSKAGASNVSGDSGPVEDSSNSGSCAVGVAGAARPRSSAWLFALGALAFAASRRRRHG